MADQGRWFKLWTTAPADPAILALPPTLRWAWVALGCYTKAHGTRGVLITSPTNAVLAAEMGLEMETITATIKRLPHVHIEEGVKCNGTFTVTWDNWQKYQDDSTVSERVRRWRNSNMKRHKRRREEKRSIKSSSLPVSPGEKQAPPPSPDGTQETTPSPPLTAQGLMEGWNDICAARGLPAVRELTKQRAAKITMRLREHPRLEYWEDVLNRLIETRFLVGHNARGWRATLDWLIANDTNAIKILEGRYDHQAPIA